MAPPNNLLALDLGSKRIGIARASILARIPEPLETLKNNELFIGNIKQLVSDYQVDALVVGLPRSMQGQETAQSKYVRNFCTNSLEQLGLPIILQDETLSTVKAEEWIKCNNSKASLDSVAAVIILEDYLNQV